MFLFAKLMSIKRKMQLCIFGCAEAEKFPRSLWFAGHLRITTCFPSWNPTAKKKRKQVALDHSHLPLCPRLLSHLSLKVLIK